MSLATMALHDNNGGIVYFTPKEVGSFVNDCMFFRDRLHAFYKAKRRSRASHTHASCLLEGGEIENMRNYPRELKHLLNLSEEYSLSDSNLDDITRKCRAVLQPRARPKQYEHLGLLLYLLL